MAQKVLSLLDLKFADYHPHNPESSGYGEHEHVEREVLE